ncbi:hypothetical protein Vadar_020978 [Vaccinium darrowii]|uniref:Uncharacterized protein n=1 Tax=Vaccinium darrowii TaxID=229202 RepID=A0ACB7XIX7_9ERIC|nr:hypothetical protein Vadar_020978 [Vaccinium darrowii]
MDRSLYIAASEGKVDDLSQHIDQLEIQTTANMNTALHVAAQLQCVVEILQACPSLLRQVNIREETPLHMAAREGYADIVKELIECAKKIEQEVESGLGGEAKKMLIRATNVDGDTALHMAVCNCHLEEDKHLEVVKLLAGEDPEFQHPANNAEETPLYLAAERGRTDVVVVLLETCTSPTYGGPGGRTALHAATLNDLTGQSIERILVWNKDLIKKVDTYGWTPLHSAAWIGNEKGVKQLLKADESVVYNSTTNKDGLETALHIATATGHVTVMEELLSNNPDCWEVVNSKGQNVLHIAIDMEVQSAITFIRSKPWLRHLINQKDNEGNTPLHLLISSDCEADWLWKHNRADKHAFNNKNMTPINLALSTLEAKMRTFAAKMPAFIASRMSFGKTFVDAGHAAVLSGRNIVSNPHDITAKIKRARGLEKEEAKITEEAKKQSKQEVRETIVMLYQTFVIVAALITTITFTAAFAIPGGYNSNQGRDQGMAVLARAAAFKAFVITNTIAMVCSVTSIFLCFTGMHYGYKFYNTGNEDEELARKRYWVALVLIVAAMFVMMLAFISAAFAVLAHSIALLVSTCIIACIPFIVYLLEFKISLSFLQAYE